MNLILETLRTARDLIASGWTTEVCARDSRGDVCATASTDAVSFCAYGACRRAGPDVWGPVDELQKDVPEEYDGLADYNDRTSQADVLALFDKTIARLEAQQ